MQKDQPAPERIGKPAQIARGMTKREARKWVRRHWATFMNSADCPGLEGMSEANANAIADVFGDESDRLARRLGLFRDFDPLEFPHG